MAQGSARIDATGEYIRRTANLPSSQNVTISGWFKLNSFHADDFNNVLSLRGSSYLLLRFQSSGPDLFIASNGDFTAFTTEPGTDEWFYAAVSANATNAVYRWWNASGALQETITGAAAVSFTGNELTVGNDNSDNSARRLDGWISQVRVWDAVLSQSELESELASSSPVRTSNINTAFEDDPATDVSGNSRPWTTNGVTVTSAEYPPNYGGGGASPTITDAGDETYTNGETGIVITGTSFGASQGSGTVKISPTDDVDDANAVAQTVTAWGDTSVTFTAVRSTLAVNTTCYLFVTKDGGYSNASGFPVSFYTVGDTYRSFGPQGAQRVLLTL